MAILITFVKIPALTKVLIIRFSSIGDIVLTTPVIRAVKEQLNGAELHFLTKRSFKPVIEGNPHIDKIYAIEKRIGEVMPQLREENYDFILDLHKNFRSMGVRFRLRKKTFSFPKLNFEKWLLVRFRLNRLPDIHIVDRYFKAAGPLGVSNDGMGLDYYIPGDIEVKTGSIRSFLQDGYVAFVVGAKHNTKALPEEKIIDICKKLNYPVALLGGPADHERGEKVFDAVRNDIVNLCGKFDINVSASFIRQAKVVITHDTGLMHIAAAYNKNIISVWGNTVPEFGMYPYLPEGKGRSEIFEVKGLSCRPCSKIGFDKCPKGHFKCMMQIDDDEVVRKVMEMLGRQSALGSRQ